MVEVQMDILANVVCYSVGLMKCALGIKGMYAVSSNISLSGRWVK